MSKVMIIGAGGVGRVVAYKCAQHPDVFSGIMLASRTVRLNVALDPAVLGGVHVSIGDEVIDGTIASRLEQARRAVLG